MSWANSWIGDDKEQEDFDITKSYKNGVLQPSPSITNISAGPSSNLSNKNSPNHSAKNSPRNGNISPHTSISKSTSQSSAALYQLKEAEKEREDIRNVHLSSQKSETDVNKLQQLNIQQHQNSQFGKYGSDWSIMMALDNDSGKELHRSLTSMSLKYEGPNGSNSANTSQTNLLGNNSNVSSPSGSFKLSGGMGPPPITVSNGSLSSPSGSFKSSNGIQSSSPSLKPQSGGSLKLSNGMGPPPGLQITPTSITNSPIIKKDKKHSKSAPTLDSHGKKLSNPNMVVGAIYTSSNSATNMSHSPININSPMNGANSDSNSSSPISGSPITPSTTPPQRSGEFLAFFRKRKTSNSESPKNSPRSLEKKDGSFNSAINGMDDSSGLPTLDEDEDDYIFLNQSVQFQSDKINEGWVEMLVSRHWKKLWFVLRVPNLEFYKGWWEDKANAVPTSPSDENGKILLNYWYTFSPITYEDGKPTFSMIQSSEVEKVSKDKKSKIKFRCDDENTARKWITDMEDVIKKRRETTVTIRPLAGVGSPLPGGRRPTISQPNVPNFTSPLPSMKLNIPQDLMDELEPDEKYSIEQVKSVLDEFPSKPLPEGETNSSYRAKRRSSDGFYRVLSMDGGGLRSVMTCILIERIVKKFPHFLEHVDIFTGTSAGSIVAAGLACEYPPKATRRVLEITALPVFGKNRFNILNNAKFNNRVLKVGCYVFFQDKKFYEIPRKLAVPTFQLDSDYPPESQDVSPSVRRWQPRVFHNLGECNSYLTQDVVGDVLLRSGAAPTYFPSYQGYIDGGVFANNPALSAMTLAMSPNLDGISPDKIICMSIGTGLSPHFMEGGQDYDWGLLNWAPKLGNLLIGAQVDYLTQLCDNILGARHFRLNPTLGDSTSMDDPKLVTELATIANGVDLEETFKWIENYFLPKNHHHHHNHHNHHSNENHKQE